MSQLSLDKFILIVTRNLLALWFSRVYQMLQENGNKRTFRICGGKYWIMQSLWNTIGKFTIFFAGVFLYDRKIFVSKCIKSKLFRLFTNFYNFCAKCFGSFAINTRLSASPYPCHCLSVCLSACLPFCLYMCISVSVCMYVSLHMKTRNGFSFTRVIKLLKFSQFASISSTGLLGLLMYQIWTECNILRYYYYT